MPVTRFNSKGFTLIELVIGMVIFAIALTVITSFISPQAGRSVDPIMQVRATELAQSFLNEISAKRYDENFNGNVTCNDDLNQDGDFNDAGEIACSTVLGPEAGESRDGGVFSFDDVDDYNQLEQGFGTADPIIRNSLGEPIVVDGENLYQGFTIAVSVVYDGNGDGIEDADQAKKLVTIVVTLPNSEQIRFSLLRSNY